MALSLDDEFDRSVSALRAAWEGCQIDKFLVVNAHLNSLFIRHAQESINTLPERKLSINFDEKAMSQVQELNKNIGRLLTEKGGMKDEIQRENQQTP